jgi:2-haloacid dehalogenase
VAATARSRRLVHWAIPRPSARSAESGRRRAFSSHRFALDPGHAGRFVADYLVELIVVGDERDRVISLAPRFIEQSERMRLQQVYFDLDGTLFDPSAMAEPLGGGGAEQLVEEILGDTVLSAMAHTLSGAYRDFSELLHAAVARRLALAARSNLVDEVTSAVERMRPFPEAEEAVETLRSAGIGAGVLTNSSTQTARLLLAGSGLELDPVVGTDQVRAFKPDPRVYLRSADVSGHATEEVALITVHGWDALGARRAGLRAAWVSRKERVRMQVGPEPDFEAGDVAEAAARIVPVSA